MLDENEDSLLLLDAASLGESGPALASRIKIAAPKLRILVVASPGSHSETAYRERKIFYYSVEPFADREIVDILHAAFCPEARPVLRRPPREASEPIWSINITNRHARRVSLLTPGGTIETALGLGLSLRQKVLEAGLPVETCLGSGSLAPADVLKAARAADRVFVLEAKDLGRPSGCLVRGLKGEFEWASGDTAEKVVSLVVQPDADGKLAGLAPSTIEALAGHILNEPVSV